MNLSEEHRALIEGIIRQNPNFTGHDELLNSIIESVYKKSYLLLDSVSNVENLKAYLKKVAENSINSALKFQKNEEEQDSSPIFQSLHDKNIEDEILTDEKVKFEDITPKKREPVQIIGLKGKENSKNEVLKKYSSLIDPIEFFPKIPQNPANLPHIISALKELNSQYPNKKYGAIFKMRHIHNLRQATIARKLKISQSDLSRRYCEMVKYLANSLSNG